MSQKGISFRLNTLITSIAILIIASVVYINHHFSNKILVGEIEKGAINQSNLVISRISRITVGTEEIARNVAYQALYYQRNNDLDFFLKEVLASNRILEGIQVELFDYQRNRILKFSSNKPGQLICNPDSINIEKYIRTLKTENVSLNYGYWSDPFYCKSDTTLLLVTYRIPVYTPDTKEIAGIVSCEVSLKQIRQMLSEIDIGNDGYAFIIDKNGTYLTHPQNNMVLHKNIFNKPSLIFRDNDDEIESKIKSGGRGAGRGISQHLIDQKSWFYYSP